MCEEIVANMVDCINNPSFKAQAQILESALSLIVGVESKFQPYCQKIIPIVQDHMNNCSW